MAEMTGLVWELLTRADPDRVAVIDRSRLTPLHVTYGELWNRSRRFASHLQSLGLRPGDRVGILADNCIEYYVAFFGTAAAGCAVVPLNTKLPPDTQAFMAEDAAMKLIVADATNAPKVPSGVAAVVVGTPQWNAVMGTEPLATGVELSPETVAVHIYTSGSTGRPKGVLLSNRAVHWTCANYGVTLPNEVVLVSAPLYHKNALMSSKLCLYSGGTVALLPRFRAADYVDAIEAHRVTFCSGIPTMYALITAYLAETQRQADLSSVNFVLIGSAPLTEGLWEDVKALFPRAMVTNGYGTTEAVLAFSGGHPEGKARPKIALGVAHPAVQLKLVDADGRDSDRGELWIRSPGVMDGYHQLEAVTSDRLAGGWYKTGDLLRRDEDGWFFFVGRVDDMFVCSGENIYPEAVEQLLERHPAVHQAVVVPVRDDVKGALPVVFVRVEPGSDVSEGELRQFALDHGPAYAHPRAVWFLDEIPLASTNKIDRRQLIEDARQRWSAGRSASKGE